MPSVALVTAHRTQTQYKCDRWGPEGAGGTRLAPHRPLNQPIERRKQPDGASDPPAYKTSQDQPIGVTGEPSCSR